MALIPNDGTGGRGLVAARDIARGEQLIVVERRPSSFIRKSAGNAVPALESKERNLVCVCLSLQDLVQSCLRGVGRDIGGHVLRKTTSRGLCGLVCSSRTSERGGEGDCVKEGGGGEGKCERERALEWLRYYIPGH